MELIAITTFLTFANMTGVVAASEAMDEFQVEQEGVVIIEEVASNNHAEPQSLFEAIQQLKEKK